MPKSSQDCCQDPKKPPKVMEGCSFLHFGTFLKDHKNVILKCSQNPPKTAQVEPNMAILAHVWRNLPPTLHKLRQYCAHVRPEFAQRLHELATKTPRHVSIRHKTPQIRIQMAPRNTSDLFFFSFDIDFRDLICKLNN